MYIDIFILILLFSIVLSTLIFFYKKEGWTSPINIFGGWLIFFIFFDAIYSIINGTYGPGPNIRYNLEELDIAISLILWTFSFYLFILGVLLSNKHSYSLSYSSKIYFIKNNKIYMIFGLLITILGVYLIINKALTLGYPIIILPQIRNLIFNNGGYLLIFIQFLPISLMFYFINKMLIKKINLKILFISILIIATLFLSLGSRSLLIYSFILPIMLIYHLLYKRISIKKILIFITILLLLMVLFRTLIRDIHFQKNSSYTVTQVLTHNFMELPKFIWGGYEVSSFDGSIDVIKKTDTFIMGESIANALVSFIPRSLWKDKPKGGGNTIYTSIYYPSFYSSMNAEYSISGVGDLYLNFSIFGMLLFFIFGILYGFLYKKLKISIKKKISYSSLYILIYSIFIFRFFSFLRGDMFNFIGQGMTALIPIVIIFLIINISNRRIKI